jgi:hypothetical protein
MFIKLKDLLMSVTMVKENMFSMIRNNIKLDIQENPALLNYSMIGMDTCRQLREQFPLTNIRESYSLETIMLDIEKLIPDI